MRRVSLLIGACLQVGCITIASSVATPTALEHQLLGVYQELDKDLVHASSVRGDVAAPPGSFAAVKSLALESRALQRFHEDDLAELKSAGCVFERGDAVLGPHACAAADTEPAVARRIERVVRDENRARGHVLQWAAHTIARNEGRQVPTADEVDEIRRTYNRLLREAAKKGHLFESATGKIEEVSP